MTDPGKIANSRISIVAKKDRITILCEFLSQCVLFDVLYHNYHVWIEIELQVKFYRYFPDLGHLQLLLTTQKKMLT